MKEKSYLTSLGIIIYIITSGIDKIVYKIFNDVYIFLAIIEIVLIIIDFIKDNKEAN